MTSRQPYKDAPGTVSEYYTYSSRPRVVQDRNRYRNLIDGDIVYCNIMCDPRVVKGRTYTQRLKIESDMLELQRQQESSRRRQTRKQQQQQQQQQQRARMLTPEPVVGRQHQVVQTEAFLEELSDIIQQRTEESQTDAFLDRPVTPLFIPAKTGKDASTQIEEGELFDFDIEVEPIVEVMVGKVVEQSLLEVMEEEELADLHQRQRAFQELRDMELVEVQRLEEQERRRAQEKERRLQEERDALQKEKETVEKVAARVFAQHYLRDLLPAVFNDLRERAYFYDPVERDLETGFLSWLLADAETELEKRRLVRRLVDDLIIDVAQQPFENQ